ncbi:hypothetical protein AWB67_05799 [Caballeronia terrestris]|jgi:hypothetical protein|uniref:Uncharacterized protein n=1 Tax=Caballeronia terrestris TaxID=1226301 RepID=A0A158KLI7_9BURK|nr:hypothetical protein AWB81_04772 [Caballeronia arationis]SAL81271.1 hypothetical protein AWB67_05799 [Caballeronia terrestris]
MDFTRIRLGGLLPVNIQAARLVASLPRAPSQPS